MQTPETIKSLGWHFKASTLFHFGLGNGFGFDIKRKEKKRWGTIILQSPETINHGMVRDIRNHI